MDWFTAVILFILIWWIVLFAVLPFGTRPVDVESEAGGWRGAPERPMLGRKAIATTLITVVLWGGVLALIHSDWLSFRHGWLAMHDNAPD